MFLVGRDYTLEKNKIKLEADHFKDILMEEFSDDDHIRKVIMGMSFSSFRMDFCCSPDKKTSMLTPVFRFEMGVQILPRSTIYSQGE